MEDFDRGHNIGLGIALGLLIVCTITGLIAVVTFVLINWPALALLGIGGMGVLAVMMKLSPAPATATI